MMVSREGCLLGPESKGERSGGVLRAACSKFLGTSKPTVLETNQE